MATLFLLRKRRTLRERARPRKLGPAVLLPGGRQAVFGDSLHLLLGSRLPPRASDRALTIQLVEEGRGRVQVLPSPSWAADDDRVDVATAYLTADGALRREFIFAWSLGLQIGSAALRLCRAALPPMRVSAVVLPFHRERNALVLTRRAARGGSYNSMWVFPGGAVDSGETADAAAAREVEEETGLRVRPGSLRRLCAFQARNEALCITYLMIIYGAEASGELRLQRKEVAQAVFLAPSCVEALLEGRLDGEVPGVAHGDAEGSLVDCPVPLRDLGLASDDVVNIGPGIGAGHWFAMQEWRKVAKVGA